MCGWCQFDLPPEKATFKGPALSGLRGIDVTILYHIICYCPWLIDTLHKIYENTGFN